MNKKGSIGDVLFYVFMCSVVLALISVVALELTNTETTTLLTTNVTCNQIERAIDMDVVILQERTQIDYPVFGWSREITKYLWASEQKEYFIKNCPENIDNWKNNTNIYK